MPDTLVTTSSNTLRITVDRDRDGRTAWHVWTRSTSTRLGQTWALQFTARRKAGLSRGLAQAIARDAHLAAFVTALPDKPTQTA